MNELSKEEREHLEKQLGILMSNWKYLEEKRVKFGNLHFPLPEKNQLDDTETEIREISNKLGIPSPIERLKPEIQEEKTKVGQKNITVKDSSGVNIIQTDGDVHYHGTPTSAKRPVSELLNKLAEESKRKLEEGL